MAELGPRARAATAVEAGAAGDSAVVTITLKNYKDLPAAELVTRLDDEFGCDTMNISPLSESWKVERDRPAHMVRQNVQELRDHLDNASRLP